VLLLCLLAGAPAVAEAPDEPSDPPAASEAESESPEVHWFPLTLDEVEGLVNQGDEESLEKATSLINSLRKKVGDQERPRVEAYAARVMLAREEFDAALDTVQPYIEDREKIDPRCVDSYFTAGLIHQAMAYRESPDSNDGDKVTFMGIEIDVEPEADGDMPLVESGLAHAIESLNLFGFVASHTPQPMRVDALEQAGQTLTIMHEWTQAKQAYQMAMDQTAKADEDQIGDDERETRFARYKKRIAELEKLQG